MSTLWLIRHPQPEVAFGVCYGSLDIKLSEAGVRHAKAIAAELKDQPFAAIYTSPRQRCRQAATILAKGRRRQCNELDALREVDFGQWEGLTYEQIALRAPEQYDRWMRHPTEFQFPGGECFADMRGRVLAAAAELRAQHPRDAIALFTHGGPIRVLIAHALGIPSANVFRIGVNFGGVSVIEQIGGVPAVIFVNWVIRESSASPPA